MYMHIVCLQRVAHCSSMTVRRFESLSPHTIKPSIVLPTQQTFIFGKIEILLISEREVDKNIYCVFKSTSIGLSLFDKVLLPTNGLKMVKHISILAGRCNQN